MAVSYKVKGNNAMYSRNEIVDEKKVLMQIKDWNFAQGDDETIVLEIDVLTGIKKGQNLRDFVTFAPDSKMNWKYKALRAAIGSPIPKTGDDEYDILELVGKPFIGDLIKSKDGRYQNVGYNKMNEDELDILIDEAGLNNQTDDEEILDEGSDEEDFTEEFDDDLPF